VNHTAKLIMVIAHKPNFFDFIFFMNLHYLINKKSILDLNQPNIPAWDVFISAFNKSERIQKVFETFNAPNKHWVILPEYEFSKNELPLSPKPIQLKSLNEAEAILELFDQHLKNVQTSQLRLCIDITGFMRPHILFLVHYFRSLGLQSIDMIYTEPEQYERKENTEFSVRDILNVRQVSGFEGHHTENMDNDILIVGVGYDHALISRVVIEKDSAKVIQLLSLPSLSADMYQESILRLERTSLATDFSEDRVFFSPANDPFVVASELSDIVKQLKARGSVDNIYLSPLATKPQTLGFALFYLEELQDEPASILFPYSESYSKETSRGVGRTWLYEIKLAP
jgi:hypothetical protein